MEMVGHDHDMMDLDGIEEGQAIEPGDDGPVMCWRVEQVRFIITADRYVGDLARFWCEASRHTVVISKDRAKKRSGDAEQSLGG